jgi:arginase
MSGRLGIIGVPSSAGAYAPGQERAPQALRDAGLVAALRARGLEVDDRGDVREFRWRADHVRPRAMHADVVAAVAAATAREVHAALSDSSHVLVLGGDCTVEIGVVAGASQIGSSIGLLYIDLDTDLNTPSSTTDGALDWMGCAHMLGLPDVVPEIADVGGRRPLLRADQLLYFATDNIEPCERAVIDTLGIEEIRLAQVAADPPRAAANALRWASRFDRLLIHLDVDVLDFVDMPLAENTRRYWGLTFAQLMSALSLLLQAPNWATLTVCELNPDHGEPQGQTLERFVTSLSAAIAAR